MAATARARIGAVWARIPRIVRRGAVVVAVIKTYQYIQVTDTLYKLSNPGQHALGATVLDLDLSELQLVAHDGRKSNSPLTTVDQLSITRVISTLRTARDDPRVSGLVCRGLSGLAGAGLADIAEIRRAVQDFSRGGGGKPSLLHVPEGLGLSGNGTVPLYFASAFDSAHVMPTSAVLVPGLSFASLFFKGTLEKLGVTPIKVARKEYKTAANSFTEDSYTGPHRESTESLMNSVLGVITNGIAEGRKMSPESVSRVFDDAIMSGPEATAASIIDECAYRDELPAIFRKKLQDGVLARRAQRVQAAREWRSSMDALISAWKNEDGAEFARWRDGANIVGIDSLLTAVRFAVAYGCPKDDDLRAHRVLKAERRALKAHLAWLDTRPWEAIARKERSKFELLHGLGHLSSIVELERRLCVEAINALENISEDILALSVLAKERDGKVEFNDSKRIIRWTRAVLRAKSFAARMVGSTTESQDAKNDASVGEEAASTAADAALHGDDKLGPCEPRMFLLHQEGDPAIPCEVGGIGHVDYCEPSKNSDSFKDRLRYQSFSDYMQLVSMEQRAGQWRAGFARPTARAQRLVTFEGLSRTEYIGGVVDAAECAQLVVLADHRNPFLQPWRMHSRRTAPTVAVINVDGAISDETSEDVRSHIRRASKDPRIQGIVMRIDSPGGSASASDLISRAVEVCKNKPIVASMSNVCASGGLFIAVPCERIFAEEATITGSCGVIFSGFLPIGLFERLGITVDSVESSKFSKYFGGAGNVTQWDAEYREKIDNLIDDMYTSFVEAVSRGRGMSFNEVETIARGRVWSGIDAKRIGMIDEFGGLDDAAAYVAEKVGAEPGIPPRLVNYPTTGMKLEDQLRRVGVIRSHRDEEGDEEAPRETKNKRRRTVASLLDLGDDGEDEDESEERDVRTNEKGGHASSGKKEDEAAGDGSSDHKGMGNEDEDPSSITDLLLQSRVSSPESADGVGSLTPKTMLSLFLQSPRALLGVVAETLADVQDDLVSSCALWCLKRLDSYLIDASPSSSVSIAADYLLNTVLARNGVGVAVAAELKAAAATSGRPAMIMSPQIHVMDGPNPK